MRIRVNGVRLFFEVEGTRLRVDGATMREVPTLLLLHGGPGIDHSIYRPAFSALADVAQLVYLDQRGNGRSERGSSDAWNLAQWADDVRAFCDALDIERPIVYGASFGGMVAMAYAARHPAHPRALVLVSTTAQAGAHAAAKVAMFSRLGGPEAGELARRRFVLGDTGPEVLAAWLERALPLYTRTAPEAGALERMVLNRDATAWFNRPGGEGRQADLLADLARIRCPTLVMGGRLDPMLPIECQRDIAAALPPGIVTYREFDDCGHGVVPDVPQVALPLLRDFIERHAAEGPAGPGGPRAPATSTALRPMSEAEFAAWREQTVPAYAADKVAAGQWTPAESLALSAAAYDELLPQGLATPGHCLQTIVDADGAAVGVLWHAEEVRAGTRIAYVYDIAVDPLRQREGHARRALLALEAEARRRGLAGLGLHVFGHNPGAQALYAQLGFVPTSLTLYKALEG